LVLVSDPTTGKTEAREVTDLIVGVGEKRMVELTIEVGGGSGTITAAEGHPFWVPDLHRWVASHSDLLICWWRVVAVGGSLRTFRGLLAD
jgi:hypothetical protein